MLDPAWTQARTIFRAVRMLQERVVRQHACKRGQPGEDLCELSFPQFNTLLVVREGKCLSIKELAELLQVSAPSASAMVERLVEMGMLTREQSQVDRREVVVNVSEQGLRSLESLEEQILQSIVELIHRIGPVHAQQWAEVYQRISEVLESDVAVNASELS